MTGKSHLLFGIGSFLLVGAANPEAFNLAEWVQYSPLALIGALLPDLDHANSLLKRNKIIWLFSLPLTLFGHRTWSHSLLMLALLWQLNHWVPPNLHYGLYAFIIGYASHILGDFMTPRGVPIFYPIKTNFSSPITFKTGTFIEYPIAAMPTVLFLIIFLSPH